MVNRKNARWRYVAFVCMAPATWAQNEDYVVKKQGYEEKRTSNHWPANGVHLFRKYGAHPGQDIEEMPDIAKTEEAKSFHTKYPQMTSHHGHLNIMVNMTIFHINILKSEIIKVRF